MRYKKSKGHDIKKHEALLSKSNDSKASKDIHNRELEIKKTVTKKKKRHKKNLILHYIIFAFFFLTISTILSLTVLFPFEKIEIIGTQRITENDILDITDVIYGTNLLRLPIKKAKKDIINTYFDIQDVKITKKIPNSLVFEIEESINMASVLYAGKSFTISDKGRITNVLDKSENDNLLINFNGLNFSEYELGEYFLPDDENFNILMDVTTAISESDIKSIIHVDVSDIYAINMYYSENLIIKVGNTKNLTDKLNKAQVIIDTKLQLDDNGILDVSIQSTSYFRNIDNIQIPN